VVATDPTSPPFDGFDTGKDDAVISSVTITDEWSREYDVSEPSLSTGQVRAVNSSTEGVRYNCIRRSRL